MYSHSTDGAFRLDCFLFSDNLKQGQVVKQLFQSWKKATERYHEHFSKNTHNSADSSALSHIDKNPATGYGSHTTA